MKLLVYCQHVLGSGHVHRMLAILARWPYPEPVLVLGGPPLPLRIPTGIEVIQLPPLGMTPGFGSIRPLHGASLEAVQRSRKAQLLELADRLCPDILLTELFPFGRKQFRFELDPLLERMRCRHPRCCVACSVRDILVEKPGQDKFERQVLQRLEAYYDLVLVHSDPTWLPFSRSFPRVAEIRPPLRHTGFVCEPPTTGRSRRNGENRIVVASIGASSVGRPLLDALARAARHLPAHVTLHLFHDSGRHPAPGRYDRGARVVHHGFGPEFTAWLGRADLAVSLAGYNTFFATLAGGVPALFFPYGENREQRWRVTALLECGPIGLLEPRDLEPDALAGRIMEALEWRRGLRTPVDLDGAAESCRLLADAAAKKIGRFPGGGNRP